MSSVPCDSSRHRHPVVALRREHLDAEVRVVDPDALVAAAGHAGHVRDHELLEVARRTLHRRLLGRVDLLERPGVDPLAAPERGELVLPGGEALGEAGDLLGIDRVLLHAGPGRCLVVARPVQCLLGVRDLDLEPLAGPGLLRDRPEGFERGRLLLDLERGGIAAPGKRLQRLLPDQAGQARTPRLDLGDVRLLLGEPGLGLLARLEPEARQEVIPLAGRLPQLLLDLRPAAEPAVDLRILHLRLDPVAAPQPEAHDGEREADRRNRAAEEQRRAAEVDHADQPGDEAGDATTIPTTTRISAQRESGRQANFRRHLEADLHIAVEERLQRRDLAVHGAQPLDRRTEHGEGRGRRMRPVELRDLVADDDRRRGSARSAPGPGVSLRDEPLGLARLLEHRAPLGEGRLGLGAAIAGRRPARRGPARAARARPRRPGAWRWRRSPPRPRP